MALSDFALTPSRVTTPEGKIIPGFLILFCHIWLEVSCQGEENQYLCFEIEQTWMGRSFKIDMFQILCDLHNIMQPARTHTQRMFKWELLNGFKAGSGWTEAAGAIRMR